MQQWRDVTKGGSGPSVGWDVSGTSERSKAKRIMALPAVSVLETSRFLCFLAWIVSVSRCFILERGTHLMQ